MRRTVCRTITACLLAWGLLVAGPTPAEAGPALAENDSTQDPRGPALGRESPAQDEEGPEAALRAQEQEARAQEQESEAREQEEADYDEMSEDDELGFRFGYRGSVSVFGGEASGGTPIGTVQNLFFNSTYETGGDSAWGIRGTLPVWWRLAGELEFLTTSPGIEVVVTDPAGQNRSSFPFAGLDMSYVAASVRLDLANAWLNPFLQAGVGGVRFSSDDVAETSIGMLFGGGVEVPVPRAEGLFGRADVRGLRADISGVGLPGTLLETGGDVVGTQVIWSVGLGYRF